jgi:hypothetical protein
MEIHVCTNVDILFLTLEITRVHTSINIFVQVDLYFAYLQLHVCAHLDLYFRKRGISHVHMWN